MKRLFFIFLLLACTGANASGCDISLPESNQLPEHLKSVIGFRWVGSPGLAAQIPEHGRWVGMGPDSKYGDKWWWWSEGYSAVEQPAPELEISAKRLDAQAPPVLIPHALNAYGPGWDRMLVPMEFPTSGCWEVSGNYHGNELRFVFRVGADG